VPRWYNDGNHEAVITHVHRVIDDRIKLRATSTTAMRFLSPQPAEPVRKGSSKPMNKNEFIEGVSEAAGLSKADAGRAVDAVISTITNALKAGNTVSLIGFGTFDVRNRAARTGRNPRTGEEIQIAAAKNPGFKAGKALKDAVN